MVHSSCNSTAIHLSCIPLLKQLLHLLSVVPRLLNVQRIASYCLDSDKYGAVWSERASFLALHLEVRTQIMWKTTTEGMASILLLLLVGAAVTMTVDAGVIERCNGAVVELVPCSDSIKGEGADPVSHGCCMALSELLLSPECLCYAATTAQGFNMKQILGLPAACKFHVMPHQTCEDIPIPSYSKPPPEDQHTPGDAADDLPALGFSDEVREEIRKEFRAHQARLDSQSP